MGAGHPFLSIGNIEVLHAFSVLLRELQASAGVAESVVSHPQLSVHAGGQPLRTLVLHRCPDLKPMVARSVRRVNHALDIFRCSVFRSEQHPYFCVD